MGGRRRTCFFKEGHPLRIGCERLPGLRMGADRKIFHLSPLRGGFISDPLSILRREDFRCLSAMPSMYGAAAITQRLIFKTG